jgi:hypothetical protein
VKLLELPDSTISAGFSISAVEQTDITFGSTNKIISREKEHLYLLTADFTIRTCKLQEEILQYRLILHIKYSVENLQDVM